MNAASLQSGPIAPGEIVTIYGTGIGPDKGVSAQFDAKGLLPTTLGGVQVLFDGVLAPLIYVQASQISVQAPYTVAAGDTTHVQVSYQGQIVALLDPSVAAAAPGLFAAVVNADGSFNSLGSPAPRGSSIYLYGTGEGLAVNPSLLGTAAQAPYAVPKLPVSLKIGGAAVAIVSAAAAPGQAGILQVTAKVPGSSVPSGPATVELTVGGVAAPPITIWLK